MEKSGKPESSCGGRVDDDPKPGPIYHSPNLLDGNYCSGQKGMSLCEEEYYMLMMNEVDSSSFPGGPDNELDPTRVAETSSSWALQQDRNARKREIDRKYRERNKLKEQEMRSKLCRLHQENRELMRENESLKGKLVCVNESLQSQATDIQHLRKETESWNFEHAKQTALVQTLSDQVLASAAARSDNQILVEQNRRLRLSIAGDDDDTLVKLAEDTANLKLENVLLKLNNDALTAKMVHHHNTDRAT